MCENSCELLVRIVRSASDHNVRCADRSRGKVSRGRVAYGREMPTVRGERRASDRLPTRSESPRILRPRQLLPIDHSARDVMVARVL